MSDVPAPIARAHAASEAIRAANHLTAWDNGGLILPSDLQQYTATLAEMLDRLPQTLEQAGHIIRAIADQSGLTDKRGAGHDGRITALTAAADLSHPAVALARDLADTLHATAANLSHLEIRDA